MKYTILILFAFMTAALCPAAETPKKDPAKQGEAKKKAPAKGDTYPLYGKVVSLTSRTLTIVRSDNPEAEQVKFNVNASTEYVNGDKPATAEAVKPGSWVGGVVKKAEGDGNDTVTRLNIGVKQKTEEKGKPKKPAKKKTEPKKKSE